MIPVLLTVGGLTIIAAIISAATMKEGGVIVFAAGIVSSLVFFALAVIMMKIESLRDEMGSLSFKQDRMSANQKQAAEKVKCSHCGAEYESGFSSCPKCGQRQ